MLQVSIVVDAEFSASNQLVTCSPTTEKMVAALKQAIVVDGIGASTNLVGSNRSARSAAIAHPQIQVYSVSQLRHLAATHQVELPALGMAEAKADSVFFCPLTLNLPDAFAGSRQLIYQQCRDVHNLRRLVEQQWGYPVGTGHYWLPIISTRKGSLYGEVIALQENQEFPDATNADLTQFNYCQPLHLTDVWRQPLYQLGYRLLRSLSAPPATYLLQFGFAEKTVCFDRLWPFPAAPAIASLSVQEPDLFACHWRCLTDQPILDLVIRAAAS